MEELAKEGSEARSFEELVNTRNSDLMIDSSVPHGAPGESTEHELDAMIARRAKKREEELGEDPERARCNAEWQMLKDEEAARAEKAELEAQSVRLANAQTLRRVYAARFKEYSQLVRMLEATPGSPPGGRG